MAVMGDVAVRLETSRLGGTLAAEVRGVDLNNLDAAIFGAIRAGVARAPRAGAEGTRDVTPAALAEFAARLRADETCFPKVKGEDGRQDQRA